MTNKIIGEVLRFAISGSVALVVQLGLLYLLTSVVGVWYLFSVVVSHTCSIILNFVLQKFFVRENYEMDRMQKQVGLFSILALSYLACNALFMYVLVSELGWPYMLAQGLVVIVLSIATFFINKNFIFQ